MKLLEFDVVLRWVDASNRDDCREFRIAGPFVSVSVVENELLAYRDWHGAQQADLLATVSYSTNRDSTHVWAINPQLLAVAPEQTLQFYTEWALVPHQKKTKSKETKRRTVILEESDE